MADNKKSPEIKQSLFNTLATGAPLAAGAAVGIKRLYKNASFKASLNLNNPLNTKIKAINKFANTMGTSVQAQDYLTRIQGLKSRAAVNPGLIGLAWQNALRRASGTSPFLEAFDPAQPFKSIEFFATHNKSITGDKVLSTFLDQFSTLSRHGEVAGGFYDNSFSALAPQTFFKKRINDLNTLGNTRVTSNLSQIASTLKGFDPGINVEYMMHSRPDLPGSQLMMHLKGGMFGRRGSAFEVPFEIAGQPGTIAHGITQQTKRVMGRYGIVDPTTNLIKETLSHEEFVTRSFIGQILPQLQRSDITTFEANKLIRNFNQEMIQGGELFQNLPTGVSPASDTAMALASHRIRLSYDPLSGNKDLNLNTDQLASVMRAHGTTAGQTKLFPATSPDQLAKGIVSDIDAQSLWFSGQNFGYERRPMQALGRTVGPTKEAVLARLADPLRSQYSWLHTKEFQKYFGEVPVDLLARATYFSEKRYPQLAETWLGGAAGGAGVMSQALSQQALYETPLSKNLLLEAGVYNKIQQAVANQFSEPLNLTPGEVLGFDVEGKPIPFEKGMNIKGAYQYSDMNQKFLRLFGTQEVGQEQYAKYFGGAKAELEMLPGRYLARMFREHTGVTGIEDSNVVLGLSEFKKNRALHNIQMLTALQEFTALQMNANGKQMDVLAFQQMATNLIDKADVFNDPAEVIRGVYMEARRSKLETPAFGRIFGALPDVMGEDWQQQLQGIGLHFGVDEAAEIEKGAVRGVVPLFYGGVSTAGGRGSVEPRFFELLQGPQLGSLGSRMAEDIGTRQILANPDVVREQSVLTNALLSIRKGAVPAEGLAEYTLPDLLNEGAMGRLLEKGGRVNMGSAIEGVKSLYVPGAEQASSMQEYITHQGVRTYNELRGGYEDLLSTAANVEVGTKNFTRKQAQTKMESLVAQLGTAISKTQTGKGYGLARREVMGSKYLRAVPGIVAATGDLHTVGISADDASQMFEDLSRVYGTDAEALAGIQEQQARLFAGESIGGILARDPNIGPFSVGPTRMKILEGLSRGNVVIPQQTREIIDAAGMKHQISLGHFAARAGDFDGDNAHLMLTSSNIEKDVFGHYSTKNTFVRAEEDYIIRQQLLKAKASKEVSKSLLDEEIAATYKLALSKTKVGPLSVPLSTMRAGLATAIQEGKLSPERYLNASSLLEALEQVPISGKHIPTSQASMLRGQMDRIAQAASSNNAAELHNITKEIFSNKADPGTQLAARLLEQGEQIQMQGEKASRFIPPINLVEATKDLAATGQAFKDNDDATMRAILLGKRKLKMGEIDQLLSHQGGLLGEFKLPVQEGLGAKLSRAGKTVSNRLAQAGGEILEHAGKPLALGFAGAIGLSAILSRPISNLDPDAGRPPISSGRIGSSNTTEVNPDALFPDSNISGEPTSPGMSRPSARVQGESPVYRVKVRGTSKGGSNLGAISGQITRNLPGSTNVNVNIRDQKTSLTQQRIDSIMRR